MLNDTHNLFQGNYLSRISDEETISVNSGIFWAMQISSGLIGNIFGYTQFKNKDTIDDSTRNTVGIVLLSVTCAGIVVMFLLRRAPTTGGGAEENQSPTKALRDSFRLFLTKAEDAYLISSHSLVFSRIH